MAHKGDQRYEGQVQPQERALDFVFRVSYLNNSSLIIAVAGFLMHFLFQSPNIRSANTFRKGRVFIAGGMWIVSFPISAISSYRMPRRCTRSFSDGRSRIEYFCARFGTSACHISLPTLVGSLRVFFFSIILHGSLPLLAPIYLHPPSSIHTLKNAFQLWNKCWKFRRACTK